jgi:hypothetical protein
MLRRSLHAPVALGMICSEDAMEGAERAQIASLFEQGCMNLGGRLVAMLLGIEHVANRITLLH